MSKLKKRIYQSLRGSQKKYVTHKNILAINANLILICIQTAFLKYRKKNNQYYLRLSNRGMWFHKNKKYIFFFHLEKYYLEKI